MIETNMTPEEMEEKMCKLLTTILFNALREGDDHGAIETIRQGADLNGRDVYGNAPLHYAVYRKHIVQPQTIQRLIEKGAKLNTQNETGNSPWHTFCGSIESFDEQNARVAEILLQKGINPHLKNNDGFDGLVYVGNLRARDELSKMIEKYCPCEQTGVRVVKARPLVVVQDVTDEYQNAC